MHQHSQHTATHCNTLQHTTLASTPNSPWYSEYNTLQHTATHHNTLQRTHRHTLNIALASTLVRSTLHTLQHTATHCNTLHHTATCCNTLQHAHQHTALASTPVRHVTGDSQLQFWREFPTLSPVRAAVCACGQRPALTLQISRCTPDDTPTPKSHTYSQKSALKSFYMVTLAAI